MQCIDKLAAHVLWDKRCDKLELLHALASAVQVNAPLQDYVVERGEHGTMLPRHAQLLAALEAAAGDDATYMVRGISMLPYAQNALRLYCDKIWEQRVLRVAQGPGSGHRDAASVQR
jgi:hypothetical protein